MGEIAQAIGMMRKLPSNVLMKNPAGTWSFVGSVHPDLAYWHKGEGRTLTDDELAKVRAHGIGLFRHLGFASRVFATEDEARKAACALGVAVG